MRIRRALAALAIATTLTTGTVACQATPAAASGHHVTASTNVMRGWCKVSGIPGAHLRTSCVVNADDDNRRFVVLDRRGHRVDLSSQRAAYRYLTRWAKVCPEEDSRRCWWPAEVTGNGVGETFLSIGGGQGTWYLQDVAR